MKVNQYRYTPETGFVQFGRVQEVNNPDLILVFGSRMLLSLPEIYSGIRTQFPGGTVLCCSTAGEITGPSVEDETLSVSVIKFEKTPLKFFSASVSDYSGSYSAGKAVAENLNSGDLKHIFILSDGQSVNGSELVLGIQEALPEKVSITGGLAGDGARFEKTLTGLNEQPKSGNITAIGLYGSSIRVGYGSMGGWDQFGPDRLITKSAGNILYEVDGQSALELYKKYLGEQAAGLPGTALLFPLAIRPKPDSKENVVRTVLSINETDKSMVFAGDMPEGWYARLMKANFDRLIDGATHAAQTTTKLIPGGSAEFAVLISCVGRKLVLSQRIEEEVEAVIEVLGKETPVTGFYSYGEISPFNPFAKCELHNQTMTITTFCEI